MAIRHLIGIGGVGMSALATALLRRGETVTGADRNLKTANIRFLEARGIRCFPDNGSGITPETDEVIVSTAIEADNPGLIRAARLGIPVTHRAVALARTLADFKLIGVAGTCGKSTVTALLGHVLAECGLDPFCVNGANVVGWEGAVRVGKGAYAVAEIDESDRSLTAFTPFAAIITNASADHFSKEEMDEVFDVFAAKATGPVIDGRAQMGEEAVSLPGLHNHHNAYLAYSMAVAIGCDPARVRCALLSFQGVERRLQRYGTRVFDDYAHNPEKLTALWETLAEAYPQGICVVWRPHGYAPLRKMFDALETVFRRLIRPQDHLILLPVYDAGGTTDRSINSDRLVAALGSSRATYLTSYDAILDWLEQHQERFGGFAVTGARDPELPALASSINALVGD